MIKKCNKCLLEKNLCDFNKHENGKYGVRGDCKDCRKKYTKEYRELNLLNDKIRHIYYRENNKDKISKKGKLFYKENKESISKRVKEYRVNNKELCKKQFSESHKKWKKKNKHYVKNRRATDILYRLRCNVTSRINGFLKRLNAKKSNKTSQILGISYAGLKEHLQSQFTEGMTFENYGKLGWHIDHKIPLSSAKSEEEIIKLCHYTNLQPLWFADNIRKGGVKISFTQNQTEKKFL